MVADAVRCLNMFPATHGASPTLSPATLVTGAPSLTTIISAWNSVPTSNFWRTPSWRHRPTTFSVCPPAPGSPATAGSRFPSPTPQLHGLKPLPSGSTSPSSRSAGSLSNGILTTPSTPISSPPPPIPISSPPPPIPTTFLSRLTTTTALMLP